ncbi:MAG TPA: murein biosynthesis integral membrane protein MurJ [Terriglobia bacterium]|nr:murein biosynthesis integral membrane protein MurJ [Terriglobia bacterium]
MKATKPTMRLPPDSPTLRPPFAAQEIRPAYIKSGIMSRMSSPSVLRRIAQSTSIVMASVLASRVLGFFIYWTVARKVGSNAITDVYYAAFTLPDFLNYLVASGSLSLIFIPVFTKYMAEKREHEAWHVFSIVLTFMGILLIALVIVAEIFAPRLIWLLGPGFKPEQKDLLISLTRLMLPAQICFYLGGILSAVQYAKAQFVVPSFAPIIYNLGIIAGGVLLGPRIGITGFSVGVVVGAACGNFLLQVYGAARAGARFRPSLDLSHPGFRLFLKLAIPIMLALSLVFMDDWIIRWFGSYLEPATITWLSNAKTLMRVPLGVVGQAVGVASFPFLAHLYSEGKLDELNRTLNSTLKGLIMMLLPISALTIAQSSPLVYLVFSHTKMHPADLDATAATLMVFSLGMFAWGAQNILARGFYAGRDTLTPAWLGTALTFLTLPLYWALVRRYQHLGLALASSIGIVAYTIALFVILTRRTHNREAGGLVLFFFKVGLASAMAGGAVYELAAWLETQIAWKTSHGAFLVLAISSTAGFLITALFAKLLRVREIDSYLKRLWPS